MKKRDLYAVRSTIGKNVFFRRERDVFFYAAVDKAA